MTDGDHGHSHPSPREARQEHHNTPASGHAETPEELLVQREAVTLWLWPEGEEVRKGPWGRKEGLWIGGTLQEGLSHGICLVWTRPSGSGQQQIQGMHTCLCTWKQDDSKGDVGQMLHELVGQSQ